MIPPQCRRLRRWLTETPVYSVSLMMVSGYMGNPASMFGHAILRFNSDSGAHGLFSTTLNYGALVPPDEPILVYIYKGLGGGYQAGYSDRYFYTQDVVYGHTEARDIWEYELMLDEAQLRLLRLHLWEVIGHKKQYFFLTRNCAYELGRVLDVVLDPPLSRPAYLWYTPQELFDRLLELDRLRRNRKQPPLIGKVKYHPSAERRLIQHYRLLTGGLKVRADSFMLDPDVRAVEAALAGLPEAQQQSLLDFQLAYVQFALVQEQPEPSPETLSLKHAVLKKRLALPPSDRPEASPPGRPAPAEGPKAAVLGAGVLLDGEDAGSLFVAAPFVQEPTGMNTLDGGELSVLDTRLIRDGGRVRLYRVDYLKILHHALSPLPTASPWSWRLLLRTQREARGEYDHQLHGGIGRSAALGRERLLVYGLLTPSLHTRSPYLRLRPEAGLLFPRTGRLKLHLRAGMDFTIDGMEPAATGALQYTPARYFSFLLEYQHDVVDAWGLSLRVHW